MEFVQAVFLLAVLTICCVTDVRQGKIPNVCVLVGLVVRVLILLWQLLHGNVTQFMDALLAVVVFSACSMLLYLLHMLGAGDVKLLGMIGFYVGLSGSKTFLLGMLAVGGVTALGKMLYYANLRKRLLYFINYIKGMCLTGEIQTYEMPGNKEEVMGMAVPMMGGVLCYYIGMFV